MSSSTPAPLERDGTLGRRLADARLAVAWGLLRAVASAAVIVAAYYVLPVHASSAGGIAVRVVVATPIIVLVVVWQVRGIQRSERPALRAVEALAIAVSLMVALFASWYLTLSEIDPASFSETLGRTGALYFTMTTLTTVGFGDIVARTDAARAAVMVQMVFNVGVIGAGIKLILSTARQRMAAMQGR